MAEQGRFRLVSDRAVAGWQTAADGHFERGNRLIAAGEIAAAEAAYRQAVELAPGFAEARTNLGNVLCAQGRWAEAVTAYEAALEQGLQHPLIYYNHGTALRHIGRTAEAAEMLRRTVALDPVSASAWNNLGNALRDLGRWTEAAQAYFQALALRPDKHDTRINLAGCLALWHEAEPEPAVAAAARWLAHEPEDAVARHVGLAMTGGTPPARADDAYVRQLFDSFAPDFERRLAELDYQAPALIAGALARRWPEPRPELEILDAGCGTGLCAPLLRPYARRLAGVDLSPVMLAHAAARDLYDVLAADELTAFLATRPQAFDLIVAADVLCYFGDLVPALRAAAAALRSGGGLIFTVEQSDDAPADAAFTLQPNGRYSHDAAGLCAALAAAGLTTTGIESVVLRHESRRPVGGLLVQARR